MKGYVDARPKYTKTYRKLCMHLSRYHDDDDDHKKIIRRNSIECSLAINVPYTPYITITLLFSDMVKVRMTKTPPKRQRRNAGK